MKRLLLSFIIFSFFMDVYSQQIKVASGGIVSFKDFKSNYVAARNVDVWLPDGYTDKNFMVKVFEGDSHTEKSWTNRFHIPVLFLIRE